MIYKNELIFMFREYYRIEKFVSSLDSAPHLNRANQNLKSKARPTGKALDF